MLSESLNAPISSYLINQKSVIRNNISNSSSLENLNLVIMCIRYRQPELGSFGILVDFAEPKNEVLKQTVLEMFKEN